MATSTVTPPSTKTQRLHGLDALRGGALLLGIIFHAMLAYVPGLPWLVDDPAKADWLWLPIGALHLFRMTLFMVMAGYFGRMIVNRRGLGSWVKDRLIRITLPLPVMWPIAILPIAFVATWAAASQGVAVPAQPPAGDLPDVFYVLTPGHLWFLVVLTQCVLITAGVRLIGHRVLGPERASGFTARLGRILSGPFALPLAAIPYAAGIILQGFAVGGLTEPRTILGSVSALTAYLGGFWFGWAIHATRGDGTPEGQAGLLRLARARWAYLIAAVVLTPVALAVTEPLWLSAAIQGLVGWMWVIGLMGLCVRHLKRERGWVRYLADASYWMYIIHLPVLGAVAVPLLHLPWPAELKLLVVLLVSVPLLLASYELLVRHTWLGGWLNGRKHPRAKRS